MKIVLYFSNKFKRLNKFDVFGSYSWFQTINCWTVTTLLHVKIVNSLINFRRVLVNFKRRVTIWKDIKQIIDWNEIETREGFTLRIQILIQCFLTNFEFTLYLIKSFIHSIDSTELKNVLNLTTFHHGLSHVLINTNELFRNFRQLFLDLFWVNEQVF